MHTNTLLGQEIRKLGSGLVVLVGEGGLVVLVLPDALNVLVEQVGRVEGSALGFRVELGTEDGAGVVDQTLVGLVVQVGEVLPPVLRQGSRVDSITVVLGGDVALAGGEVKGRDVVCTVSVLQLERLSTGGESNELMTHANTHNGDLGALEQFAEVVHGGSAVGRVTGAVGDEDTIEVVSDLVDGVVEGEAGNTGSTGDETAEDVLLDTAINQSNVHVPER